jgi:hypothetical protein
MQEDYLERIDYPEMTYYRETYKNSKRWTGEPLNGKTLLIYCEQGFGDTIQFSRYFKIDNAKVILHCPKELHRLMVNDGYEVFDKDDSNLPLHDYHVLSMSLPFILNDFWPKVPYIKAPSASLGDLGKVRKVGICWEGSPTHPRNIERSCPLRFFKSLIKPDRKIFMLQKEIQKPELTNSCEDMDLLSIPISDFYDLATLVNAMDVVVSVDTAVLHLAGAMGKFCVGLLHKDFDWRWKVRPWYPNMVLLYQGKPGEWVPVFAGLMMMLDQILASQETKNELPGKMEGKEIVKLIGESFESSN